MQPNNNNRNKPRPNNNPNQGQPAPSDGAPKISRGQAVRDMKRSQMDAQRIANQYTAAAPGKQRANFIDDSPRLKIIGLGGMDGGGTISL